MAKFTPNSSSFNTTNINQIATTDRVQASFVNGYYQTFINNDAYLNFQIGRMNNITAITFTASGWTGATAPYTQEKAITGYNGTQVTGTDRPEITINTSSVTVANIEDYLEQCGYIYKIETGTGKLTATAYEKPTMNITVNVKGV